MIEFALEQRNKDSRYREIWLIFDRDEIKNFDSLIKKANNLNINVGWSNPCFEIWLMAYFSNLENISNSKVCCDKFEKIYCQKTKKKKYKKSEKNLYKNLLKFGDEKQAIERAKSKYCKKNKEYSLPSEMKGTTAVYKLVEELRIKMGNK